MTTKNTRPNIGYENIALLTSSKIANNPASNSGNNIEFVKNVVGANFAFESNRQNISSLGSKGLMQQSAQLYPEIQFSVQKNEDFDDLFTDFRQHGESSGILSGGFGTTDQTADRNFYMVVGDNKGVDVTGETLSGRDCISFGNCSLANLSISQNVRGVLTSSYDYVGSNIQAQQLKPKVVYSNDFETMVSGTGLSTPHNYERGLPNAFEYVPFRDHAFDQNGIRLIKSFGGQILVTGFDRAKNFAQGNRSGVTYQDLPIGKKSLVIQDGVGGGIAAMMFLGLKKGNYIFRATYRTAPVVDESVGTSNSETRFVVGTGNVPFNTPFAPNYSSTDGAANIFTGISDQFERVFIPFSVTGDRHGLYIASEGEDGTTVNQVFISDMQIESADEFEVDVPAVNLTGDMQLGDLTGTVSGLSSYVNDAHLSHTSRVVPSTETVISVKRKPQQTTVFKSNFNTGTTDPATFFSNSLVNSSTASNKINFLKFFKTSSLDTDGITFTTGYSIITGREGGDVLNLKLTFDSTNPGRAMAIRFGGDGKVSNLGNRLETGKNYIFSGECRVANRGDSNKAIARVDCADQGFEFETDSTGFVPFSFNITGHHNHFRMGGQGLNINNFFDLSVQSSDSHFGGGTNVGTFEAEFRNINVVETEDFDEGTFMFDSELVQNFDLNLPIGRKSIYEMGKKFVCQRKLTYPNLGSFGMTSIPSYIDASPTGGIQNSYLRELEDFTGSQEVRNIYEYNNKGQFEISNDRIDLSTRDFEFNFKIKFGSIYVTDGASPDTQYILDMEETDSSADNRNSIFQRADAGNLPRIIAFMPGDNPNHLRVDIPNDNSIVFDVKFKREGNTGILDVRNFTTREIYGISTGTGIGNDDLDYNPSASNELVIGHDRNNLVGGTTKLSSGTQIADLKIFDTGVLKHHWDGTLSGHVADTTGFLFDTVGGAHGVYKGSDFGEPKEDTNLQFYKTKNRNTQFTANKSMRKFFDTDRNYQINISGKSGRFNLQIDDAKLEQVSFSSSIGSKQSADFAYSFDTSNISRINHLNEPERTVMYLDFMNTGCVDRINKFDDTRYKDQAGLTVRGNKIQDLSSLSAATANTGVLGYIDRGGRNTGEVITKQFQYRYISGKPMLNKYAAIFTGVTSITAAKTKQDRYKNPLSFYRFPANTSTTRGEIFSLINFSDTSNTISAFSHASGTTATNINSQYGLNSMALTGLVEFSGNVAEEVIELDTNIGTFGPGDDGAGTSDRTITSEFFVVDSGYLLFFGNQAKNGDWGETPDATEDLRLEYRLSSSHSFTNLATQSVSAASLANRWVENKLEIPSALVGSRVQFQFRTTTNGVFNENVDRWAVTDLMYLPYSKFHIHDIPGIVMSSETPPTSNETANRLFGPFTFLYWVRPYTTDNRQQPLFRQQQSNESQPKFNYKGDRFLFESYTTKNYLGNNVNDRAEWTSPSTNDSIADLSNYQQIALCYENHTGSYLVSEDSFSGVAHCYYNDKSLGSVTTPQGNGKRVMVFGFSNSQPHTIGYNHNGDRDINDSLYYGEVAIAAVYNKCLSSGEVADNFNRLRGRFPKDILDFTGIDITEMSNNFYNKRYFLKENMTNTRYSEHFTSDRWEMSGNVNYYFDQSGGFWGLQYSNNRVTATVATKYPWQVPTGGWGGSFPRLAKWTIHRDKY